MGSHGSQGSTNTLKKGDQPAMPNATSTVKANADNDHSKALAAQRKTSKEPLVPVKVTQSLALKGVRQIVQTERLDRPPNESKNNGYVTLR